MPEPVTTAMIVGALVWAFAEKAAGKVGEKTTESLWARCQLILKGDDIITIFPQASDSANIQKLLESRLEERLFEDAITRKELEEGFHQLPQQLITELMRMAGDNNTFQDIFDSSITENKIDIKGAGNLTLQGVTNSPLTINMSQQASVNADQIKSDGSESRYTILDILEGHRKYLENHIKHLTRELEEANRTLIIIQRAEISLDEVKETLSKQKREAAE
jgi:hypothetical protein